MAVKFECPRCGRKFTEQGAEKLGFRCPQDKWCPPDATDEIELVRAGTLEETGTRKASLKRTTKKKAKGGRLAGVAAEEPRLDLAEDVEEIEEEEVEEVEEVEEDADVVEDEDLEEEDLEEDAEPGANAEIIGDEEVIIGDIAEVDGPLLDEEHED